MHTHSSWMSLHGGAERVWPCRMTLAGQALADGPVTSCVCAPRALQLDAAAHQPSTLSGTLLQASKGKASSPSAPLHVPSDCISAEQHRQVVHEDVLDAQDCRGGTHAMQLHFPTWSSDQQTAAALNRMEWRPARQAVLHTQTSSSCHLELKGWQQR